MKTIKFLVIVSLVGCATSQTGTVRRAPTSDEVVNGQKVLVTVIGGDEKSFIPPTTATVQPIALEKNYDVVVVGGGLAGLTAATYLSDRNFSVLILEKENHVGGLAAHGLSSEDGILYDRGGAYWTSSYEEELEILKRIGLGNYEKEMAIAEPIDNFYWHKKLFTGIWDDKTLQELPASFALFRKELKNANDEGYIPNQPIEEAEKYSGKLDLDRIDAATWIRSMPHRMSVRKDPESVAIYKRYVNELKQGKMDSNDPMLGVVELMDLYCRSALGSNAKDISGVAFANFYISEIEVRYSTETGTTEAAGHMMKLLEARSNVTISKQSQVIQVQQYKDGVETRFIKENKIYSVQAKYIVYAAPVKFAPDILLGMKESTNQATKKQVELMKSLEYSHYSVHNFEMNGHPYRLSYDTWSRPVDYREDDFTDFILSRWVELKGYEGYHDFSHDPAGKGLIAIYHPLPKSYLLKPYSEAEASRLAVSAAERFTEIYQPVFDELNVSNDKSLSKINITKIMTSRWPFSVHVAAPGHFINNVRVLRKPFGRVFFANNNLGTPAFEEALFRGHCAANNITRHLTPSFQNEKWSRCPMEK